MLRTPPLRWQLKASAAVSLIVLAGVARGQSTIDNDPDMAPGFTSSVFHTPSVDSINLYNGQVTIPIAIGPSYPLGPKLKYQAYLTYNSYGYDYPYTGRVVGGPVMAGDTAFGIGWSFTLGAIKNLPHAGLAYVAPDGSQHVFSAFGTSVGYYKTTDATSFYLHNMGTYGWEMWDGDGNHYVFGQHVTGYDDPTDDFRHDYGRGRDGWYLSQLYDPFGNGFSASYPTYGSLPSPCWVIVNPYCDPPEPQHDETPSTQSKCNLSGAHWVPQTINLTSGATISIGRKSSQDAQHVGYEAGLISSFTFDVPVNGTQTTRTWSLDYQTEAPPVLSACGQGYYHTYRLTDIHLPSDLAGSPSFHFDYTTCPFLLMSRLRLPTGGTVDYAWGQYNFYHGRYIGMCFPSGIPSTAPAWVSGPVTCGAQPKFPYVGFDCSGGGSWLDSGTVGVIARIETDPISGLAGTTTYTQYAFPFGEHDTSQTASYNSQSLTVVVFPPDANGKQRSKSILFYAGSTGDTTYPGDRTGADIREADYDFAVQAYPRPISQPVCNGGTDRDFCPNHAFRVTQRTFEYDASGRLTNRHLQSETKIYGATNALGQCTTCLNHSVSYSNTMGRNWDAPTNDPSGNGRHYNVETHGGNLGGDFRQIVTTWKPSISPWFPNLLDKRITSDSTGSLNSLNQYFDYDHTPQANGFLKGVVTWDSVRNRLLGDCRYSVTSRGAIDSHGNVASRYTATFPQATAPDLDPKVSCSLSMPSPSSWGGNEGNGDIFATDFTYRNGQKISARPVDKNSQRGAWLKFDVTRDSETGWITSSRDTAGLQTSYLYDSLGRPTSITPPGEVVTAVSYDSTTQTTAVRNGGSDSSTWFQFQYDGFGRTICERRQMPGGAYAKRFTKFDGRGYEYFQSEWVADSFGEAITADVGANCAFSGSSYPTNVPSAAPGTYRACFDPYGRPQLLTGAGYSSQVTISRTDSRPTMMPSYYSDTNEVSTVACVSGTFLSTVNHCTGGADATTTTVKDAFGRATSVTEPSGDVTSYGYDILDKLTSVAQGAQSGNLGRRYIYDRFGFLRSGYTPEEGTVTYDTIGSLGNVLQQTEPGNLVLSRSFDYAGRLTGVSSNEPRTYVTNTYDEGSRGSSLGKLTTSVSKNYALSTQSTVTDSFWYSGLGGRLSTKTEVLGGSANFTATQTFGYNSLGLLSSHAHPRSGSDPAFTVSWTFNAGLPVSELVNGATVVSGMAYRPSGALASYTTNNGPSHSVTTTISQDGNLPRPSRIWTAGASSNFDSGVYGYDGAGNIRTVGSDTFGYDLRSRLLSANIHDDMGTSHPESFSYDRYGNILSRTADGSGPMFSVDATTNRLVTGSQTKYDPRGNLTLYGVSNYTYDGLSRQTSYSVIGSVDERYLYDAVGERVARFTPGTTGASGGYFYTVSPCRVIDTRDGGGPVYGQTIRTFAANNCGIPAYATTLAANVTSANVTSAGYFRVFPAGTALPTSTTSALRAGRYTANQAFVSVNGPISGSFSVFGDYPAAYTADFTLDVSGYFAHQTANTQDSYSLTLRDPQNRLATKYNLSGGVATVDKDYVYLGNQLVATWQPSTGYSFFTTDHLGTPRLQTDVNATVVTRAKNRAFGLPLTGALPLQGPEFAAMEKDSASGNHFDHARFYTGWQGRFQVPDTLGGRPEDPQSWNRYSYSRNNPLRYVDPDGRDNEDTVRGFFNALGSDFLAGAGRSDIGNADYHYGQAFGDAAATIGGTAVTLFGAGGEVGAVVLDLTGFGAAIGVPVNVLAAGVIATGATGAGFGIANLSMADSGDGPSSAYKRPSGATTPEQRKSVQGKPCVDCGEVAPRMNADHKDPLVEQHYRGGIDKAKMKESSAVQPQCPTCSNRQGAYLKMFSDAMRTLLGF